ncbi:hypothetical protein AB0L63_07610 [Nocardia sp. NPDC051990]|uniref:hypothetical protein n=1 Tax=Nocardia sp. NPDC051990 TaxID=3155285 RepID=UPI003445B223
MKLTGRFRPAAWALGLLAAALLIASLLHCTLLAADHHAHGTAQHPHAAAPPITALVASAVDGSAHAIADLDEHHGAPHAVHCFHTPALPATAGSLVPLLLVLFALVTTMVAAAGYLLDSGGVRGPPVAARHVVSGRVLLTRICIARR